MIWLLAGAGIAAVAAVHCRRVALRQGLLLAASYLFYSLWGLAFLAILIASSLANFGLGRMLEKSPTAARLWAGIAFNIGLLALFKYVPDLGGGELGPRLAVPLGLSFWTFQAISHVIDTYRGDTTRPTLLEFCLFMAFWPTVVMGPICRVRRMVPQFRTPAAWTVDDLAAGLPRVTVGLFMKVVLAGLLASTLGGATAAPPPSGTWGALDVWLLGIGYGFHLYFDFAGYSHIVIGAARAFGFRLDENFDRPLLAVTPAQFWTRWHMSLSSWIRDYVFMPLAMLARPVAWRHAALLISMTLFGLWHGATVPFLLWGAYHGVVLIVHRVGQQVTRRRSLASGHGAGAVASWLLTFAAVSLGWVLFFAADGAQATAMLAAVLSPARYTSPALPDMYWRLVLLVATCYFAYALLRLWRPGDEISTRRSAAAPSRWWWLAPAMLFIALFASALTQTQQAFAPFIYASF